jgi:hypothetical protein
MLEKIQMFLKPLSTVNRKEHKGVSPKEKKAVKVKQPIKMKNLQ